MNLRERKSSDMTARVVKREQKPKVLYLIIFVAILVIGILIGMLTSNRRSKDNTVLIQAENSEKATEDIGVKDVFEKNYFEIGQEMAFATQTIKVSGAKFETVLQSEYSNPWVAKSGTKFIVVEQTVVNTTANSFMFEECVIFDSEGRKYEASGDAIGNIDNYMAVRDLAPGIPETGVSVYIVPESSTGFEFGALNARTEKLNLTKLNL